MTFSELGNSDSLIVSIEAAGGVYGSVTGAADAGVIGRGGVVHGEPSHNCVPAVWIGLEGGLIVEEEGHGRETASD